MPEVTNLALARIVKLLERAKSEAEVLPDSDGGLHDFEKFETLMKKYLD